MIDEYLDEIEKIIKDDHLGFSKNLYKPEHSIYQGKNQVYRQFFLEHFPPRS